MQRDMKFAPDVNSGGMYLSRRKKAGMFAPHCASHGRKKDKASRKRARAAARVGA